MRSNKTKRLTQGGSAVTSSALLHPQEVYYKLMLLLGSFPDKQITHNLMASICAKQCLKYLLKTMISQQVSNWNNVKNMTLKKMKELRANRVQRVGVTDSDLSLTRLCWNNSPLSDHSGKRYALNYTLLIGARSQATHRRILCTLEILIHLKP